MSIKEKILEFWRKWFSEAGHVTIVEARKEVEQEEISINTPS
jgi:hypothetical protein